MKIKVSILAALALSASTSIATAADRCFQDVALSAVLTCDGSGAGSRSADFVAGCKYVPSGWTKMEVACPPPPPGMWINVTSMRETQGAACARVGLRPADLDGQICASGNNKPSEGLGADAIRYDSNGDGWSDKPRGGAKVVQGWAGLGPVYKCQSAEGYVMPPSLSVSAVAAYYCGP
ncbi:MAG: hypothetical protein J0H34_23830 [Rhizobiales bacterium]|nr:hypothetical protein [Hyphomicrobiales bacterium]